MLVFEHERNSPMCSTGYELLGKGVKRGELRKWMDGSDGFACLRILTEISGIQDRDPEADLRMSPDSGSY